MASSKPGLTRADVKNGLYSVVGWNHCSLVSHVQNLAHAIQYDEWLGEARARSITQQRLKPLLRQIEKAKLPIFRALARHHLQREGNSKVVLVVNFASTAITLVKALGDMPQERLHVFVNNAKPMPHFHLMKDEHQGSVMKYIYVSPGYNWQNRIKAIDLLGDDDQGLVRFVYGAESGDLELLLLRALGFRTGLGRNGTREESLGWPELPEVGHL